MFFVFFFWREKLLKHNWLYQLNQQQQQQHVAVVGLFVGVFLYFVFMNWRLCVVPPRSLWWYVVAIIRLYMMFELCVRQRINVGKFVNIVVAVCVAK